MPFNFNDYYCICNNMYYIKFIQVHFAIDIIDKNDTYNFLFLYGTTVDP